jgi:tetratricopeptide (TPR) repeat protein
VKKEEKRSVEAAESKEEIVKAESGEVAMSDSTSSKEAKKRGGDSETVKEEEGTGGIKEDKRSPDAIKGEGAEAEVELAEEVKAADLEDGKVATMEKDAAGVEDEKAITGKEDVAKVEDEKEITGKEEVAKIEDEKAITGKENVAVVEDDKILTDEDKVEEIEEAKVLTDEEEVDLKQTEVTGDDEDEENRVAEADEKTSLSSEILKNISELKKHKASLFHFLETGEKKKHKPEKEKSKKSAKKLKNKKKDKKEEDKEESKASMKHTEPEETIKDVTDLEGELQDYPEYEEEDPEVIKNFLKKLEKSNPPPKRKLKKEEQKKLIEKFIQSDQQMQSVRSSKEITEKKDLSLSSVKFRDDIISENLAGIMVKQGKHEKAIDIYKKLIWKFPQKKAYFATQIDALKKKSGK